VDISKLGNWLQVGANVGILAGLILVSIQISENTRISKVELTARSFEIAMQHDLTKMGENPADVYARSLNDPESLSTSDIFVLDTAMWFWHDFHSRLEYLLSQGLVDEGGWFEILDYHAEHTYGGSPIKKALWEQKMAAGFAFADWEKYVDDRVVKSAGTADGEWLEAIIKKMKKKTTD